MRHRPITAFVLCALLSCLGYPRTAAADPSPAELTAARKLFEEGVELEKRSSYAEAFAAFDRAYPR